MSHTEYRQNRIRRAGIKLQVAAAEKARKEAPHRFRTGSVWNLIFRMFRRGRK